MSVKNLRSPLLLNIQDNSYISTNVNVWIYTGAKKNNATLDGEDPTYSLVSSVALDKQGLGDYFVYDLSTLIADYLENHFDSTFPSEAVFIAIKYGTTGYNASDEIETTTSVYVHDVCVNGYDYYGETSNEGGQEAIFMSNRTMYRLDGQSIKIPINQYKTDKLEGYSNGVLEGTVNINNSSASISENTDSVIRYIGTGSEYVIVTDTDGNTERIDVVPISECKYTPYKVVFVNKFGAYQELWFFKKSKLSAKVDKESFTNESLFNKRTHSTVDFNASMKETLVLNSGFVNEEHNEVFRQLVLSERAWIDYEGDILPINIKKEELDYKTSVNDRLINYTIEVEFSFNKVKNLR